MQENDRARLSYVQTVLPWAIAAFALLLYSITLNHWVTLDSLPYVAKVTGWDWTLPYQTPLFYLLTYPARWLPATWQPLVLNFFSTVCAAFTLALLARSVALLPHDRTHEQRARERSEFSLLSIRSAWLPPVLAALVCGLELTFWENATAATNEALDLLLFAYVIRCLLEYRISERESWLLRLSFVYCLGVTNNFAMIGFFPCLLVAMFWIKGLSFFEPRFVLRMFGCGLLGLSLYLLLPVVWTISDTATVTFWQALHAHWTAQKAMLLDAPQLRTRVVILSLTSILPLLVIGIRWPATFGDTSPAGAALSSVMFRVIHTVFLGTCIWVAFDQQFSPRALGFGVAFLSFYYLGAIAVGYFSGYLLLVFGESRSGKSRHRRSDLQVFSNRVVVAAVFMTLAVVPAALIFKNWKNLQTTNGPWLRQLTELSASHLPPTGSIVLSDDPYSLLLLSANLSRAGSLDKHLLVHTRSLLSPDYHQQLNKRHPNRWPNLFTNQPPDEIIDDGSLLFLITQLSRTNSIFYLHPSFGYYFEPFFLKPQGLIYQLISYPTNSIFPTLLTPVELADNQSFWRDLQTPLKALSETEKIDSRDVHYIRQYYSRALNTWGVTLQRNNQAQSAGNSFNLAVRLNTNNAPAESNLEFNRVFTNHQSRIPITAKGIEEKFGIYRGWETMLLENGPFDQPDFCIRMGQMFGQQGLFRQSAIEWDRVRSLDPTNILADVALAEVYLSAHAPTKTMEELSKIRSDGKTDFLPAEIDLELIRLEASAQYNLGHKEEAEKSLWAAFSKYPTHPAILDPLIQIYAQTDRLTNAFETAQKIIDADRDRPQSYIQQAALFLNNKEPKRALESINQILSKSPKQPEALLYKVFILSEAKDYASAKSEVDRLLSIDPENTDALLNKASIEIESKEYPAALETLRKLLKRQPNNATALRNRAFAYLQLKDLAKAEQDYNTMRRLGSRDFVYVAYWGLGEIAYQRKEGAKARKFYRLYLQYAPRQESPELAQEKKMVADRLAEIKEANN